MTRSMHAVDIFITIFTITLNNISPRYTVYYMGTNSFQGVLKHKAGGILCTHRLKISRVGQNGMKCLFIFKMLVECLCFSPWRKWIWVRTPGVSFIFIKFSIKFWAYWYMDSFGEVPFLIFKNWLKIFKNWLKSQKWNFWKIHSKSGKNRSPR